MNQGDKFLVADTGDICFGRLMSNHGLKFFKRPGPFLRPESGQTAFLLFNSGNRLSHNHNDLGTHRYRGSLAQTHDPLFLYYPVVRGQYAHR